MTVRPLVGVAALVVGLAAESGALDSYEVSAPSVFDSAAVDRTGDACGDFYRFACGGWLAKNPLPADESRFGRFNELHERNLQTLRGILERAAIPSRARSDGDREIGDYYAACMDEAGIETKGLGPLREQLARSTTRRACPRRWRASTRSAFPCSSFSPRSRISRTRGR